MIGSGAYVCCGRVSKARWWGSVGGRSDALLENVFRETASLAGILSAGEFAPFGTALIVWRVVPAQTRGVLGMEGESRRRFRDFERDNKSEREQVPTSKPPPPPPPPSAPPSKDTIYPASEHSLGHKDVPAMISLKVSAAV